MGGLAAVDNKQAKCVASGTTLSWVGRARVVALVVIRACLRFGSPGVLGNGSRAHLQTANGGRLKMLNELDDEDDDCVSLSRLDVPLPHRA